MILLLSLLVGREAQLTMFRRLLKPNGEFIFAPQLERVAISPKLIQSKEEAIASIITQIEPSTSDMLIIGNFSVPLNFIANLKPFLHRILTDYLAPKNYVRILEQAFGTGDRQITYNGKLPFNSHWKKDQIQPIIITATRR